MKREVVQIEPIAVRRGTAAALLDCSPTTIHRLIKEGKLSTVQVGSDLRVTVASLKALGAQVKSIALSGHEY